jgi:DNA-binding NtrC family response regulator
MSDMPKKPSLMLLDDEPIVGKRLKPALEKLGLDVESFERPSEAVRRFDEKPFDIVVTDMRMDEMDGDEVIALVMERSPDTKIIVISGCTMPDLAQKVMAMGVFEFINKPFAPDELKAVVLKAIEAMGLTLAPSGEEGA